MADTRTWGCPGDASQIYTHPRTGAVPAREASRSQPTQRLLSFGHLGRRRSLRGEAGTSGILAAQMVGRARTLSSSRAMPIKHGPAGRRAVPDERA
jgi:hypothetical protein